jgi:nucleoside-diphosphate-sugar epimerase
MLATGAERMSKKKIVVTGGSGKAGRACVAELLEHGNEVLIVDQVEPRENRCASIVADLRDFGQVMDALCWAELGGPCAVDGVVHLAAIPAPRRHSNSVTFANNTLGDYHVFEACRRLGIRNVVYASSETVLGLPFDEPPPYVPVDEEYSPRPQSAYSLSKVLAETMAQQFCRWDPQLKMIGLRLSNIMEPQDYARFGSFQEDAGARKWNLWGYIDARDAAQAMRLGIECNLRGAEVFIIANADTVMEKTNAELMEERFASVPHRGEIGENETLLSIEKAKRSLGYRPRFGWRGEVGKW